MTAHSAAHRELMKRPTKKSSPVTHESIRKTCEIPRSHTLITPHASVSTMCECTLCNVSTTCDDECSTGSECIVCEAKRKAHVQSTKGKVKEFMPHPRIMLFRPLRTHVVRAAHSARASHIHTVLPIKVGKAQPTSTPLKPHSPSAPSSSCKLRIKPVAVETIKPSNAPHATEGIPER